jgi:hydrogenase nickel incorporation protein HypA/HybF
MHELALSRAIVAAALRHAGGRPVTVVHVRVGALRQAVPESLAFYFGLVSRGGGCEGAELELESMAALLRCPECAHEWDPAPPPLAEHAALVADALPPIPAFGCPDCGAGGEPIAGEQLEIAWIEVEDSGPGEARPGKPRAQRTPSSPTGRTTPPRPEEPHLVRSA